jgi:MerR family redox-sensitive transcriptional activator SoxR
MTQLAISELARTVGLNPSAIRYYEALGILPAAERVSGQRRYDRTALYRLAVVQRARQAGFALRDIRELFCDFPQGTRADARWRQLADRKLAELNALAAQIASMRDLLKRMKARCRCETLELCGKIILQKGVPPTRRPPLPVRPRKS